MSFPPDVITRNITTGYPFGLIDNSDELIIEAQVTPSRSMVWAASGSVGVGRKIVKRSEPGMQLSVPAAVTDQPGWLDGAGNALSVAGGAQTHILAVKVFVKTVAGVVVAEFPTKNITLPTGDRSDVDLDLLVPVSVGAGVTVAIPDIWTAQLAEAQESTQAAQAAAAAAEAAVEAAVGYDGGTEF